MYLKMQTKYTYYITENGIQYRPIKLHAIPKSIYFLASLGVPGSVFNTRARARKANLDSRL